MFHLTHGLRIEKPAAPAWLAGCWALLWLAGAAAFAQKLQVETFTVGDGLPSAEIYDLAQDPSGRLWVLTRAGFVVYDGREFDSQSVGRGLPREQLAAIELDAKGRPWTVSGASRKVYVRAGGQWRPLADPPTLPNWPPATYATSLAVDAHPFAPVMVGTTTLGLQVWDGKNWSYLGVARGLASNGVIVIEVHRGEIFVGTTAGLCTFDGRKPDCRLAGQDPRLGAKIRALASDGSALWILADSWLGRLEGGGLTVVAEGLDVEGLGPANLGSIVADGAGGIFFGSPILGYHLDVEGRWRIVGEREGLAAGGMTALLRDREGHVWIGGARGLSRVGSQRFLSFDGELGLLDDEVSALAEVSPGRLVLGHNGGLTLLDGARAVRTVALAPALAGRRHADRVLDLAAGGDGDVWVAAEEQGLLRLLADGSLQAMLADNVFSVELDDRGRLWVGGYASLFVGGASGFERVNTGYDLDQLGYYRRLDLGRDGELYVACRRGLLWRDGDLWRLARGDDAAASNVFGTFAEASGTVWVGTGRGLYQLRDDRLVPASPGTLGIDRPVYFILRDRGGRLWLGTDDGVRISDGGAWRRLTFEHGLAGRETNRAAGLVDHRGRVWIGTDQGLSVYQEAYDSPPAAAPGVELEAIEVDGRLHGAGENFRLAHHQNTLVFHFDSISFSREEPVVYRYRLDGFDRDWQGPETLSGNEIRYTNLTPGSYRFRIAAGWAGGPWSAEATSSRIVVERPLWRRPWVYALGTLAVVLAVLGVHALRTQAIRARNRELEALTRRLNETIAELEAAQDERQLLIEDLESKNRELERFTYTVSHDLKSPLVTIKGFLGLLEKDAAAGDTERMRHDVERIAGAAGTMGRLLEELLELSRVGRVVHAPETVDLGDLAREAAEAVAGQIAQRGVSVEIAGDLPAVHGDRVRLLEVVQNLVENGVKFMGDEPSPRIEIGSRKDGAETVFVVRDNGIGIAPRYHGKIFGLFERLDQSIDGTGVGLTLVQRIVEVHGGRIWVESEGEGRGAAFCFTLPQEI